jgi:hypothetical protein
VFAVALFITICYNLDITVGRAQFLFGIVVSPPVSCQFDRAALCASLVDVFQKNILLLLHLPLGYNDKLHVAGQPNDSMECGILQLPVIVFRHAVLGE